MNCACEFFKDKLAYYENLKTLFKKYESSAKPFQKIELRDKYVFSNPCREILKVQVNSIRRKDSWKISLDTVLRTFDQ